MAIPHRSPLPLYLAGALGLATLLFSPVAAPAQEICLDCHDEVRVSELHGGFDCADCHADVDLEIHPDPPPTLSPGEICAQCHDSRDDLAASAHQEIACGDCHGPGHDLVPASDLKGPISPVNQFKTCGTCHDTPADLVPNYMGSVHAHALLVSGLIGAPSCSDCHGAHDVFLVSDERSLIHPTRVPETCGTCHLIILDTWQTGSAHGKAWEEGNEEGPVCTTCHASHEILQPTDTEPRLHFPESCGGCHEQSYHTFRDSFHGQATDLGFRTAAICSDCHTPHANLPADDPASSTHVDNLTSTCGKCHGEVSASFATFDPHADPTDPERSKSIYLVWLLMTSLLVGVFAFFGIHDLLWLQRSVTAVVRGEIQPRRWSGGPWVRRFKRGQRRTHMVVVVSFLLLAATGLPLKYHFTDWAKGLSDLLGGVAATSFLHRFAAIVTFGYFFYHLGDLVRRGIVNKEPGMFWGWKSMVPRTKDVADLWQNLKYFLYMGRRPDLDRYSYWEKFDYFAVFWGVAIIGFSGLTLWLPELFASLLPGWILNAAMVIHADEALLATGFIFVFHFFHTHLRPESFPLDPVIFVGCIPLERFKEERPMEYRRMVQNGTLEDHLVDKVSPSRVRTAYVFGFGAVTIGLLLVIGIIIGLLSQ